MTRAMPPPLRLSLVRRGVVVRVVGHRGLGVRRWGRPRRRRRGGACAGCRSPLRLCGVHGSRGPRQGTRRGAWSCAPFNLRKRPRRRIGADRRHRHRGRGRHVQQPEHRRRVGRLRCRDAHRRRRRCVNGAVEPGEDQQPRSEERHQGRAYDAGRSGNAGGPPHASAMVELSVCSHVSSLARDEPIADLRGCYRTSICS
jgi:hypothetical protein